MKTKNEIMEILENVLEKRLEIGKFALPEEFDRDSLELLAIMYELDIISKSYLTIDKMDGYSVKSFIYRQFCFTFTFFMNNAKKNNVRIEKA